MIRLSQRFSLPSLFITVVCLAKPAFSQVKGLDSDDADYMGLGDEGVQTGTYKPSAPSEPVEEKVDEEIEIGSFTGIKDSPYSLRVDPSRRRDVFWPALASYVLPGFDQWWEGQDPYSFIYSGAAAGGLLISSSASPDLQGENETDSVFKERSRLGDKERMYSLGLKIYDVAGSYSAYHSFRTAVRSRQAHGEYAFLKHEETPLELAMSPFRFSYLKRSTTYIPLGIGLALAGLQYSYIQSEDSNPDSEIAVRDFTGEDALYTTAFSYGAGTGEEALTRGWLMPLFRESMGSDVWSNAAQAVIFGALHYSSPTSPFFAAGMGYYLGWVAQQDEWRLGESTFIHFWWDVMAFAVSYTYQEVHPTTAKVEPLWLPTFALYF